MGRQAVGVLAADRAQDRGPGGPDVHAIALVLRKRGQERSQLREHGVGEPLDGAQVVEGAQLAGAGFARHGQGAGAGQIAEPAVVARVEAREHGVEESRVHAQLGEEVLERLGVVDRLVEIQAPGLVADRDLDDVALLRRQRQGRRVDHAVHEGAHAFVVAGQSFARADLCRARQ